MVTGLTRFRDHFKAYSNQFVLIGGTACDIVFSNAGLAFRATKDFDIVLFLEAGTPEFGRVPWDFIRSGGYFMREQEQEKRKYYRFSNPSSPDYPFQLELFSRAPGGIIIPVGSRITPLPLGEDVSSLSGILMDGEYYDFLQSGKRMVDDVPVLGAEHLMAFKAKAWLDLSTRKAIGGKIDSRNIEKHLKDVIRLYINMKALGILSQTTEEAVEGIRKMFRIE